jgi:hypothetical protein
MPNDPTAPGSWLLLEQAHLLMEALRETATANPADVPCGELAPVDLQAYLEGRGDAATGHRVAEHLVTCDACRRAMNAQLPASPPPVVPETSTLARGQLDALFAMLPKHPMATPVDMPEADRGREEEHGR